MKDKTLIGGIVVMVVGAVLIGVVWLVFFQPARTPSAPLTAVPITLTGDSNQFTIFEIVPTESLATFTLSETLRGLPTTVVGRSREIAGQIAIDFENPANSQMGPIQINARTLMTDNEFRNNAINNFILDTEQYELITFTPRQMTGLPSEFTAEEPIELQIEGDLTIREITKPVTFAATVTANGRTELNGSATAQILRADFGLQIPDAPGVANVSDEVQLTFEFTAKLHK
ncbi:MAG: YceI family protein [Ardenticatenaceae bacterium]|nr:YceI family protein [Ardenticatenaceae bacterium]